MTGAPSAVVATVGMVESAPAVVLASASRVRAEMLCRAGLAHAVEPARIDEEGVRAALQAQKTDAAEAARHLAELKACQISARHPEAVVIGADQILSLHGEWFEKPPNRAAARTTLLCLRGEIHTLTSAVVVARAGAAIWHHVDRAELAMRDFSEEYVEAYLDTVGDTAQLSVGAYQLEGLGAQLFARVEGDFFTILGLPLLPLLGFLRQHGVLMR